MSIRSDRLVFLDLETSTSDENLPEAAILEVGLTVTDLSGRIVSEKSFVAPLTNYQKEHLYTWDEKVLRMHTQNDLLYQVLKTTGDFGAFNLRVKKWVDSREFADDNPEYPKKVDEIYMVAGSGLHFDRRYIGKFMPWLNKKFTYYNIDVGVLRRFWAMHNPSKAITNESYQKAHRALECNRESIATYIYFMNQVKGMP